MDPETEEENRRMALRALVILSNSRTTARALTVIADEFGVTILQARNLLFHARLLVGEAIAVEPAL